MKPSFFVVALLTSITLSGCIYLAAGGAVAGGGAYAWASGNLSRNYPQPLTTTLDGVLHSLGNLNIVVVEKGSDSHYASIKGNMAKNNKEVIVDLEKWTESETKVTVRVGTLGDQDLSKTIHEEVARSLR